MVGQKILIKIAIFEIFCEFFTTDLVVSSIVFSSSLTILTNCLQLLLAVNIVGEGNFGDFPIPIGNIFDNPFTYNLLFKS